MKWVFNNAAASFADFRKDWDALNRIQNNNHILLDSRFVWPLIQHFASKDVLLAVSSEGSEQGLALVERAGTGTWNTFQPSQAPLGMIVFGQRDEEYEGLAQLVRALPGYAALLGVLQQDPPYSAFSSTPNRKYVETMPYIETPRLQFIAGFEEYWQARSKNLKHNLDRQNRRIKEQGRSLELVVHTDADRMADCVREYGRIESAGWKAAGGTAIGETTDQGRFYREILEEFSKTGEASVYQLVLDGIVVASDICLSRGGMLVVLKTTYDEKVDKLSPALLMRREIVHRLHDAGQTRVIEFYGRLREWHTQWMTDARTMFNLNVFRHPYMVATRKILKRFRKPAAQTA